VWGVLARGVERSVGNVRLHGLSTGPAHRPEGPVRCLSISAQVLIYHWVEFNMIPLYRSLQPVSPTENGFPICSQPHGR